MMSNANINGKDLYKLDIKRKLRTSLEDAVLRQSKFMQQLLQANPFTLKDFRFNVEHERKASGFGL